MVCELHHSLCLALATENSISVITHLLKCLAALIQNTPYHRLEPGLITKLVESVRSYLKHKGNAVAHCVQLSGRNLYFAYLSKFMEYAFGNINKHCLKAVNLNHASRTSQNMHSAVWICVCDSVNWDHGSHISPSKWDIWKCFYLCFATNCLQIRT